MTNRTHPIAIHAADAPPRAKQTSYPPQFAARLAGREKRPLGDLFGLRNFGVNLTRPPPGVAAGITRARTARRIDGKRVPTRRRGACAGRALVLDDRHGMDRERQ